MSGTGTLYPAQISTDYERTALQVLNSRVCMHGINTADRHINIEENPVEINGVAAITTKTLTIRIVSISTVKRLNHPRR